MAKSEKKYDDYDQRVSLLKKDAEVDLDTEKWVDGEPLKKGEELPTDWKEITSYDPNDLAGTGGALLISELKELQSKKGDRPFKEDLNGFVKAVISSSPLHGINSSGGESNPSGILAFADDLIKRREFEKEGRELPKLISELSKERNKLIKERESKNKGGKMSKKTHKMPDGSLMAGATHRETYADGSEVSTRMQEMTVDGFRAVILEREIEGATADAETNNTDVALGIRQAEEKVAAMSDEEVGFKLQQAKDAEMDSNMDIGSRNFQQNKRAGRAEGGSMLVPPEMEAMPEDEVAVEEDMVAEDVVPVDTYPNIPPEEMDEAMASQLPDEDMMQEYIDFVVGESLDTEEQDYLMNSLSADPQLSQIFDKVVETASEFSGAGEVTGPGSDVSDSIPARLSAGEFVMTKKATDQLGADNLQTMMDEAERAYDGGLLKKAFGGLTNNPLADEKQMMSSYDSEEEVKKQMITANQMPSIRKR